MKDWRDVLLLILVVFVIASTVMTVFGLYLPMYLPHLTMAKTFPIIAKFSQIWSFGFMLMGVIRLIHYLSTKMKE